MTIVLVLSILGTYFLGRYAEQKILINDIMNDLDQFSLDLNLQQFKKHLKYKYKLI